MRSQAIYLLMCGALVASVALADGYESVRIVAPAPETTVHDNNGNLDVAVEILPSLHAEAGDRLVLLLDGKPVASESAPSSHLTGIDRGSHTLLAQVTAPDGSVRAVSAPVKFCMWRASRLFRGRPN